jgi:hypothetical protein
LGAPIEKFSRIQRFRTLGDTLVGLTHFFPQDSSDSYRPLSAPSALLLQRSFTYQFTELMQCTRVQSVFPLPPVLKML